MSQEIVPGIVAFLKTTEEPVFVLQVEDSNTAGVGHFFAKVAHVRRPVISETAGIRHLEDTFYLEELETSDEKSERVIRDMAQMQERIRGNRNGQDTLPSIN